MLQRLTTSKLLFMFLSSFPTRTAFSFGSTLLESFPGDALRRGLLRSSACSQRFPRRHLQEENELPVCNANGTVNFSNEANYVIFSTDFQPMCTCEEVNADDDVAAAIQSLNISDTDAFVVGFNQALGQLFRSSEYSCSNTCESCFDDGSLCGLWETREATTLYSKPGNFTLQQIVSQNITDDDIIALLTNVTFSFDNCITYTFNQSGTLCASVQLNTIPIEGQDQPCTITYNDVACNSCVLTGVNAPCYVADCSNLDNSAAGMINSCADTIGPFRFLSLLSDDNISNATTITPGRCGPIAPTAPSPLGVSGPPPVAAPVAPLAPVTSGGDTSGTMNRPIVLRGWFMLVIFGSGWAMTLLL